MTTDATVYRVVRDLHALYHSPPHLAAWERYRRDVTAQHQARPPETLTADPTDRRQVIAQAWYPTDTPARRAVPYFEAQDRMPGSIADDISVVEFSGSEYLDAFIPAAGGHFRMPGDYVWSNQRLPYSQSGQWGYLRVLPANDGRIKPLKGAQSGSQQAAEPAEQGGQAISVSAR